MPPGLQVHSHDCRCSQWNRKVWTGWHRKQWSPSSLGRYPWVLIVDPMNDPWISIVQHQKQRVRLTTRWDPLRFQIGPHVIQIVKVKTLSWKPFELNTYPLYWETFRGISVQQAMLLFVCPSLSEASIGSPVWWSALPRFESQFLWGNILRTKYGLNFARGWSTTGVSSDNKLFNYGNKSQQSP